LAVFEQLRQLRFKVNERLEPLRKEKVIGASLEAKLLLYPTDSDLWQHLQALNPGAGAPTNQVDELRYFFLTSQVELLENAEPLKALKPEYLWRRTPRRGGSSRWS
jgi:isoleucyl-tRNA synthetase